MISRPESGTFATLFSGGEGWGVGAVAAGLRTLWGIEKNADIAAVANRNLGGHVHVADVTEVDPSTLERPEFLHASPPCPRFSPANQGASESDEDIALARATARFVEALRPRVFTLENVWLYRRSTSWEIIRDTLYRCGYWVDVTHINAADFGVPQTRRRMIVRAIHGAMVPYLPIAEPWVSWYESIEDLIPTLPESQFAPWQMERMDGELRETVLLSQGISRDHNGNEYGVTMRNGDAPAFTVTANWNMNGIRAFLCTGQYDRPNTVESRRPQTLFSNEPACVVRMTTRCLARWQTFPDWYELPESTTLASRIIGNAVPCLLAEKLLKQLQFGALPLFENL